MSGASIALRRATVAALRGHPPLATRLTGLFDSPPPGQPYPYLSFGPDVTSDWSHKSGEGREHRLQLSLWDDAADRSGMMEAMAEIEDALDALPSDIGGHRLVSFRLLRSLVLREPAGIDQGIMEFRARTFAA